MPEDVAPRPADLVDALRELASSRIAAGAPIEIRIPASERAPLAPGAAAACCRICEEALDNAVRHARARRIVIELTQGEQRMVVRVHDDGVGFDPLVLKADGMSRMEELARAAGAGLQLRSAPSAGTCVSVYLNRSS